MNSINFETEPTPTPSPGYPLGIRIELAENPAQPGNPFQVKGFIDNPDTTMTHVPVVFILDVYQIFFFWPSWNRFDPPAHQEIDYEYFDIPNGSTAVDVIPSFIWPDTGTESVYGLYFYGAMLNPEMDSILGEMALVEWGYGP